MADALKAQGNAAFSAGNFEEAIGFFTKAIELDPTNHVLFSNRSAAKASLHEYEAALEDAKKCVELKPDWPKGYSRLGAAYHGLENFPDAIESYQKGLEVDPSNAQLQKALSDAKAAADAKASGPRKSPFGGPEMIQNLAKNPITASFLAQPDFIKIMTDLQRDPASISQHLQDPRVQMALKVGLGLDFSFAGKGPEPTEDTAANGSPSQAKPREAAKPAPAPEPEPEPEPELSEEEKQSRANQADATKEKELGNEAYKKKEFDTAIAHYNRAIELNDKEVSFLTNRAACYFEMGSLEQCIEDCDKAVELARELKADYKLIGRALTRKGNALGKLGRLEEAVTVYNKALTEHRNPDTLKRLNETEKALKTKKEQDYINMDLSNEEKDKGNQAFKEGRYPEAVKHYEDALKRGPPAVNPEAHKLHSNLAASLTKLGAYPEAQKHAERCIELCPSFAKGYSRKGTVLFFMKDYDKALQTYQEGLEHDPDSQELQDGMRRCIEAIQRISTGQASEEEIKERQAKAMADPEVQRILTDPVMRQVLQDLQTDPGAAQKHMSHPEIRLKLNKLVAAGIIQLR